MPTTHDAPALDLHLGPVRLYVHSIFGHLQRYAARYVDMPLIQRGETYEDEYPYRTGESVVLRLPLTNWAVIFGYWNLPDPDATAPGFVDDTGAAVPIAMIEAWRKPAEVTSTEGTAYEDTDGVVAVGVDEEGKGGEVITHVKWRGESEWPS